ncbi:2,3-diphosphoglycerate-dependent phosphoglycerate mutase GpmB [soil metagenome]
MELILVRHGEPQWVRDGLNVNDPVLTERGGKQAKAVADRLADSSQEPASGPIDRLLVSPAARALATAVPIGEATGLEAEAAPWLLEFQLPDSWEGQPVEIAREAFARQRTASRADWWEGFEGSETIREFHKRVSQGAVEALAEVGVRRLDADGLWSVPDDAPERWVAVAHGGTNSTLVSFLLGCDPEPWEWERFNMGHASVAVLATVELAGAAIWSLRALGDANHLDLEHRTE